mgnify:CR=1 FL=1
MNPDSTPSKLSDSFLMVPNASRKAMNERNLSMELQNHESGKPTDYICSILHVRNNVYV